MGKNSNNFLPNILTKVTIYPLWSFYFLCCVQGIRNMYGFMVALSMKKFISYKKE